MEISLEANPNTNRPNLFADLRLAGINRLSLGIQALNDKDLKFLGRTHNLSRALHAVDEVTRLFDNHSADLIYARPGQTAEAWKQELNQISELGLKHLSLYQLTIEEGTFFARKGIKPMDDEPAAELYALTQEFWQQKAIRNMKFPTLPTPVMNQSIIWPIGADKTISGLAPPPRTHQNNR